MYIWNSTVRYYIPGLAYWRAVGIIILTVAATKVQQKFGGDASWTYTGLTAVGHPSS